MYNFYNRPMPLQAAAGAGGGGVVGIKFVNKQKRECVGQSMSQPQR
jgi:hypothetical protein